MGKRRKYTEEFKREAVRLMESRGDRTVADVAESLGVVENLLHSWKRTYADTVEEVRQQRGETPEEELKRLRLENAQLKRDQEISKNSRGLRPTCWARSAGRATTRAARKERPAAFWRRVPLKNMVHGAQRT